MPACQSGRHEAKGARSGRAENRWLSGNPACPTSIIDRQRRDDWAHVCVPLSHCLRESLPFTNLFLFCLLFFSFGLSLSFSSLCFAVSFFRSQFAHKNIQNASSYCTGQKARMLPLYRCMYCTFTYSKMCLLSFAGKAKQDYKKDTKTNKTTSKIKVINKIGDSTTAVWIYYLNITILGHTLAYSQATYGQSQKCTDDYE